MKTKCLYPKCNKPVWTRGLCSGHRTVAYKLVKKGLTTWERLENSGKCLPIKKKESSSNKWFLEAKKELHVDEITKQCTNCTSFNTVKRHSTGTFALPECYYWHCLDCDFDFDQT